MFGLTPDIIRSIKEAFSKFSQIEKVILYGSRAKGNYKDGSDIDITLLGDNLNLKTVYALETVIDELYLPYTFDISIFTQIDNDDLLEHILSVGRVFYLKKNVAFPEGWDVKKLGEIAKINYGYTEKASFTEVGPKFLRITDIKDNCVEWRSVPYCECSESNLPKYLLEEADIVFARTGATTGKSYLVKDPPKAVFASYLIRLKLISKEDFSPEFVSYYFQTKLYWDIISEGISGSAQGGFNAKKLGQLLFPLPPLSEQKRIVAILDKAFAAMAKAKAKAEQNLKNAKELFESYLQGVFENKGEGWEEKKINEIGNAQTGTTPKTKEKENYGDFIPFIKPADVDFSGVGDIRYDNAGLSEMGLRKGRKMESGSILMVCIGATIGKVGFSEQVISCNQQINSLTVKKEFGPKFIYYAMTSKEFQDKVVSEGKGAQATLPIINKTKWENLTIPFPKSKAEQQTIVKQLNALSAKTKKLEVIYQQKLEDLEELKKSILQKAFNGEL
jgi:type I restriction enzyme, S subunit